MDQFEQTDENDLKKRMDLPKEYLSWLQTFSQMLPLIPFSTKLDSQQYQVYLIDLTKYLTSFYKRTHPLVEFKKEVQDNQEETFDEEWNNCCLYGWEKVLEAVQGENGKVAEGDGPAQESKLLFCSACDKTFQN